jgi:hypothetical protein
MSLSLNRDRFTVSPTNACSLASTDKFEQSVVPWEKDGAAAACPQCRAAFTLVGDMRRSHCRLCGCCVCRTAGCSDPVSLREIARHIGLGASGAGAAGAGAGAGAGAAAAAIGGGTGYDVVRVCAGCYAALDAAGRRKAAGMLTPAGSPLQMLSAALATEQAAVDALLVDAARIAASLRRQPSPGLKQDAAALKQKILAGFDRVQGIAGVAVAVLVFFFFFFFF